MSWASSVAEISAASNKLVGVDTSWEEVTYGVTKRALVISKVTNDAGKLADLSGETRDIYSIARCLASEVGSQSAEYQLATACAIYNEAIREKKSPFNLLVNQTSSAYKWSQGRYGEQHGAYASTRQDPRERHVVAARVSRGQDLVSGASRWFDAKSQDGGKQGSRALTYDAIGIAKKWSLEGWEWIGPLPGVASYKAAFLRKGPKPANPDALIKIIELGRTGDPTWGPKSQDKNTQLVAAVGLPLLLITIGL